MATNGSGPVTGPATVPVIDSARCSGCGRCVAACLVRIITLEVAGFHKHAIIMNPDRCSLCGRCIAECLVEAISF